MDEGVQVRNCGMSATALTLVAVLPRAVGEEMTQEAVGKMINKAPSKSDIVGTTASESIGKIDPKQLLCTHYFLGGPSYV